MSFEQHAHHDDPTRHELIKRRLLFALAALLVSLALALVVWEMALISSVVSRSGIGTVTPVHVEITDVPIVR